MAKPDLSTVLRAMLSTPLVNKKRSPGLYSQCLKSFVVYNQGNVPYDLGYCRLHPELFSLCRPVVALTSSSRRQHDVGVVGLDVQNFVHVFRENLRVMIPVQQIQLEFFLV